MHSPIICPSFLKGPVLENNFPKLIRNGDEFFDELKSLILKARKCIFLHMYILTVDKDSQELFESLIVQSNKGIDIYIIIDGFGSSSFDQSTMNHLRKHNIKVDFFSPITAKNFGNIGRRLHQKVMLIDNQYVLIGGTNISEEFIHPLNGTPWLDYACVLNGAEISEVQKKIKRHYLKVFPQESATIKIHLSLAPLKDSSDNCSILILENDYTRLKREIQRSYIELINNAKSSITMSATYFLPGKKLLKALKKASARGVEIELIFGEHSDILTYNIGEKYLFPWYKENNMNIFIWSRSIIHGKIALIDNQISSIGSYNHNVISKYANVEMNAVINDQYFGSQLRAEVEHIKSQCKEITNEDVKHYHFIQKAFYFLFYRLSSILDTIQTLFIIRKKKNDS